MSENLILQYKQALDPEVRPEDREERLATLQLQLEHLNPWEQLQVTRWLDGYRYGALKMMDAMGEILSRIAGDARGKGDST